MIALKKIYDFNQLINFLPFSIAFTLSRHYFLKISLLKTPPWLTVNI